MSKEKIYYAGFVSGKIHSNWDASYTFLKTLCIYKTKYRAKLCYRDVRPVRIVEVKK